MQNFKDKLKVDGKEYSFINLNLVKNCGFQDLHKLPKSLKILLENTLRYGGDNQAFSNWLKKDSLKKGR